MKKFLITIVIILVLFIAIFKHNTDPKIILSKLAKNGGIRSGDLVYKINFLGVIPLGEAVFQSTKPEVYQGRDVYHLNAVASGYRFISRFFKASAVFDSYIDKELLSPILFKQELILPGKEPAHRKVYYDQVSGIMTIDGQKRKILPYTQDPLSAIFNLRRMDFDKAKDVEMNLNTNQKNYLIKGTVKLQDIILNKKIYKTVFIQGEIKRRDKNPYHKTRISMFLLKDRDNLPILIRVFASGTLIYAGLAEVR